MPIIQLGPYSYSNYVGQPRISNSRTSGGSSFSVQIPITPGVDPLPPTRGILAVKSSNGTKLYGGFYQTLQVSNIDKPTRSYSISGVDFGSYLTRLQIIKGYSLKASLSDHLNNLLRHAGAADPNWSFPLLSHSLEGDTNEQISLDFNGQFLAEALDKISQLGYRWYCDFGSWNDAGNIESSLSTLHVVSLTTPPQRAPFDIILPSNPLNSTCYPLSEIWNLNFNIEYPEINRVIVKGKGGILAYADSSLINRTEIMSYSIPANSSEKYYQFLSDSTSVSKVQIS